MRIWILAITIFATLPAYSQLQVWPGDANNDGVVNTLDVLYLGVGFNNQGPARSTQGNTWQANQASIWSIILPDSTNAAYLDCNGNGFIDIDDLSAIQQNFGLTHPALVVDSFPVPDSATSPVFYFVGVPDSLQAGDSVSIDVYAGSNIPPADFFGLALSFGYDSTLVVSNSVVAEVDSPLGSPTDPVIFFTATDGLTGNLEIALTKRANTGGSSGTPILLAGQKLLSISLIIEDNLIGKTVQDPLVLTLSNINMYSKYLDKSSGLGTQISIPFKDIVASAPTLDADRLIIYPQPASHLIMIEGLPETGILTLTDITGKTLLTKPIESGTRNELDCSMLSTGLYLLHINTPQGTATKKILID